MESNPFVSQKAGSLEQAFLDAFTSFLRAAILYPANNRRVLEAEEALLEAVRILAAEGKPAVFRFSRNRILLGEGVLDPEPPQALWLKDRFSRTGLAGLTVKPTVERDTLYAFAQKLAENFKAPRDKRSFAHLWGEEFPGMELEELRFASTGAGAGTSSPELLRQDLAGALKGSEAMAVRRLFHALEESAKVQKGLERVQKAIQAAGGGKPQHQVDLLDRIIQNLPAEALGDPELSLKFVELSLREVELAITQGAFARDPREEEILRDLLDTVGCGLFGRDPLLSRQPPAMEEQESLEELPKWEREGDKLIQHDVEAFLQEYEALPEMEGDPFHEFERSVIQEALGTGLHIACLNPDPALGEQVEHLLHALLAVTRPGDVNVIRPYLDPLFGKGADQEEEGRAQAVLGFLQRAGGERVLQECGTLTPVTAAATFPKTFPLFLDGLDVRDPDDLDQVKEVCRLLGPRRIREAKEFLGAPQGILTPHRVEAILSVPGKEALPLVEVIIEEGTLEELLQVGRFLRSLKLDSRGATAFRVLQEEVPLPPEFLLQVCKAAEAGTWPEELRVFSFRLLRQWISRPELETEKRIRLLRALGPSREKETKELLLLLKKGKEPNGKGKVPRALRKEAKALLDSPGWKGAV